MKILAASDFHEDQELTEAAIEEANSGDYDLFLNPGDFVSREEYERFEDEVDIPFFACTGNWDFEFEPPENGEYDALFNYMKVELDDLRMAFIGSVFPDDFMEDITDWTDGVAPSNLVMVSHYPPERAGDATVSGNRAGMTGFRKLIMKLKPAIWLCGHIHEAFGHYSLMDTDVFNCAVIESGKCFSIELGDEGVEDWEEVDLR